jgi:hypothetical protein
MRPGPDFDKQAQDERAQYVQRTPSPWFSRRAKGALRLFLSVFPWVASIAVLGAVALFLLSPQDRTIVSTTLPTRTPCAEAIIDAIHPPTYPNATQPADIPITEQEAEEWTSLMFTRTFQTLDSPRAVLDYYRDIMTKEGGWGSGFVSYDPSQVTKTPGASKPDWVEPEVASMPGLVEVLRFTELCPYSYHFHYVDVTVRSSSSGPTLVALRVYEYRH